MGVLIQLENVPNELALLWIVIVHVFNANLVAVSFLQGLVKLSKRPLLFLLKNTSKLRNINVEFTIKVG